MKPLVSVVIPAKNEAANIDAALRSVARQDYPVERIEVVVVDGDSVDNTGQVAKDVMAAHRFHRSDVLTNPGGNTPSNLNAGLRWAEGEYIVRVDARSAIPSDYLARTTGILVNRPDVVAVGGSQVAAPRSGSTVHRAIAEALNNPWAMGGSRYRRGAKSGPADTVYLGVFRRSELAEAGGWNEHFSTNQDFELSQRLLARGTIWFEEGLPVRYLPRGTVRELFWQYHRFGRWKSHYWRAPGQRPQRRQLVLLLAPPIIATFAIACARLLVRWNLLGRIVVGALAVGAGAARLRPTRLMSWVVNGVVGAGWWTGVVRGVVRDDVTAR
ncbi:MAG: glycosyltransferase [Acidimicrobiales bacterium]|nr:glycosyltransferase [Acidimicrobiales bacterium]